MTTQTQRSPNIRSWLFPPLPDAPLTPSTVSSVTAAPASPTAFQIRLAVLTGLAVLVLLTIWAGLPPTPEARQIMAVGVAGVVLVVCTFLLAGWHLLIRPLPKGHAAAVATPMSGSVRFVLGMLIAVTSLNLLIGGAWDEVWHRQFGVPLGEDFLWRPHLMMYTFFLSVVVFAFLGFALLMRNGKGTMQQRFRANPFIGMLVLLSGFVLFALPADPAWHGIYGADISAWSMPHLILGLSWIGVQTMSPALLVSTLAVRQWIGLRANSLRHSGLRDALAIIAFTVMLNPLLQIMTTDWYTFSGNPQEAVVQRPEWLLTAIIAALSAFIGTLANVSLRRWGAATVVGIVGLLLRLALMQLFNFDSSVSPAPWGIALVMLVAVDITFMLALAMLKTAPTSIMVGIGVGAGTAFSLPLVNQWFTFPDVSVGNMLGFVIFALITAMGGAWLGEVIGNAMMLRGRVQVAQSASEARAGKSKKHQRKANAALHLEKAAFQRLGWFALAALVGTLLFAWWLIVTAVPPL